MQSAALLDPRQRVREAVRRLVREAPEQWREPSLFVFRNRVLDLTSSDARPYVELMLDAWERFGDRFPRAAVPSAVWDAQVGPLVMQWTSSRFLQPEMARWAIDSWGYALGRIAEVERPQPAAVRTEPIAALAARLNAKVAATGKTAWKGPAWRPATAGRQAPSGAVAPIAPNRPPIARPPSTNTTWRPARPTTRSAGPPLNPWIARSLLGVLGLMAAGLLVRVAMSPRKPTINAEIRTAAAPTQTVATTIATPAIATQPADSGNSLVGATIGMAGDSIPRGVRVVAPQLTGGVMIVAPERPGVPSVTRTLLPTARDSTRLQYIEPVRRAAGEPQRLRPMPPTPQTSLVYDEVRLVSGSSLKGRVEVVRAGTIIFRDMRSGLRYEFPKDSIEGIITEFGTIVRFRGEGSVAASRLTAAPSTGAAVRSAPRVSTDALRRRGVSGRYRIRYEAATAVGSPECTSIWTRAPNAEDVAIVRHVPGADTLSVTFEGGDQFPSSIDPGGYFASTFRIVPDQARTMTALTTRLSGRFTPEGGVAITINLVFFRRLRAADVTCNVTVNAAGRRESPGR